MLEILVLFSREVLCLRCSVLSHHPSPEGLLGIEGHKNHAGAGMIGFMACRSYLHLHSLSELV